MFAKECVDHLAPTSAIFLVAVVYSGVKFETRD